MRILLLQASARTAGNTARMVKITEEALNAEAARTGTALETEVVDLIRADIGTCRGCRSCFDRGERTCPLDDGLLALKDKMKNADGLVLAGPVYVNDVNGIMKNWIDRLAHVCHRPEFAGKTALLLATTGDTSARHSFRSMQVPLWTWGYRVSGKLCVAAGALMPASEMKARHRVKIDRSAGTFLRDIRQHRAAKPSFLNLLVFRIQQSGWARAAPGSIDYAYWRDKSWLDTRHTTWFVPHRANPVKVGAARLVGRIVAAFTT